VRERKGGKRELNARARFIHMFVKVSFDDAVIINTEALAYGILSDFKTSIEITP
jgi:hypothetical protein